MHKNISPEVLTFVPDEMAFLEQEMLKNTFHGYELESFTHGVLILIEQYCLGEKTAIRLNAMYQEAVFFLYDCLNGKKQITQAEAYKHVRDLLIHYYRELAQATGLHYNISDVVKAEIEGYKSYANGNIQEMMAWTEIYLERIYDLPKGSLKEAVQEREKAFTIVRGSNEIPPTKTSWEVIDNSLQAFYQHLLSAIVTAYQIELP